MSYSKIDTEKQQVQSTITEIPLNSPTSSLKPPSQLLIYQRLIGNVDELPPTGRRNKHRLSFYHQVLRREKKARVWYWISGITFAVLVTAQIVFCLSIVRSSPSSQLQS